MNFKTISEICMFEISDNEQIVKSYLLHWKNTSTWASILHSPKH